MQLLNPSSDASFSAWMITDVVRLDHDLGTRQFSLAVLKSHLLTVCNRPKAPFLHKTLASLRHITVLTWKNPSRWQMIGLHLNDFETFSVSGAVSDHKLRQQAASGSLKQ